MPPDYPYSIHLVNPDSTYNFDSYEAVCYFLDTTHLISAKMKTSFLQDIEAARHPVKLNNKYGDEGFANLIFILFVLTGLFLSYMLVKKVKGGNFGGRLPPADLESSAQNHFVYKGCDLEIDTVTIEIICLKYNAFYRTLSKPDQNFFMEKLLDFMQRKQFWIYGEDRYREMPVLLSATATQLIFKLESLYLDNYPIIVVKPQAYLAYEPLRILTGNVQGNTITVSWEHFLKDNLEPNDGNNVGLHEMAHAFAMQMLYTPQKQYKQNADLLRGLYTKLTDFTYIEKQKNVSLFDAYSLQNADECWAKCIELFFEKPIEMNQHYPELYVAVKKVLNQ